MKKLTHTNARGEARMVGVAGKAVTERIAVAEATLSLLPSTVALLERGENKKGDVFAVARIAGILASKKTPELVPLCHAVALTKVTVDVTLSPPGLHIAARVEATDRTGVEMEALTAASVAALAAYDMLKAVDRAATISLRLVEKRGGKSDYRREPAKVTPKAGETGAARAPADGSKAAGPSPGRRRVRGSAR